MKGKRVHYRDSGIGKSSNLREFGKQKLLQTFALLGMAYLMIFSYIPMFGIIMAFKDYTINKGIGGIFSSKFVGFKYFIEFFSDYKFGLLLQNTLCISILKIIFTFPIPILFAIFLNEVRSHTFKKIIQTASYLPHFISWVVVSGFIFTFLSSNGGVINSILLSAGLIKDPVQFLTTPEYFWGLAVISDIWKEMGWWAIIFMAAIAGIDQTQYEAAYIDGAGRMARIWYITLPGIKGTITVILILALGNLLGGGLSGSSFEQSYLLGNAMNISKSEIIQTYVFKVGLSDGRYAYATAVGLLQSVISVLLIYSSNIFSKKITGAGLF